MIDLTEMNIMFTLNGEMLISDSGSEMAFKDIEIGDGEDLGYNVVYVIIMVSVSCFEGKCICLISFVIKLVRKSL